MYVVSFLKYQLHYCLQSIAIVEPTNYHYLSVLTIRQQATQAQEYCSTILSIIDNAFPYFGYIIITHVIKGEVHAHQVPT